MKSIKRAAAILAAAWISVAGGVMAGRSGRPSSTSAACMSNAMASAARR